MNAPLPITPDELHAAVDRIRKDKARGKLSISLSTAAEVLKAVDLGVISKTEARLMFGLRKRRAPVRRKVAKP
jgi:hypothetical protein